MRLRVWGARRRFGSRCVLDCCSCDFSEVFAKKKCFQEGYLAEHAVDEEDRVVAQQARLGANGRSEDPMEGLEGLGVAGPQAQ